MSKPAQVHRARRRFGQNFLHDQQIIERITAAINASPDDKLVEIGPGQGAMTASLLEQLDYLLAIEIDRDLIALLRERFSSNQLIIHEGDALSVLLSELRWPDSNASTSKTTAKNIRVVGNLPYNISTPLLFHLFQQIEHIQDMHFMLQKEVVDRLCASPNTPAYGRLSIMAQRYCSASALFTVPPSAFTPQPKVTSAIVRLLPHSKPPFALNEQYFAPVVKAAFGQRRKTLKNALSSICTSEHIEAAGIKPSVRAETLSPSQFGQLSLAIANSQ